jgi:N-acetylated-alpha-linked acidic dipeptidase
VKTIPGVREAVEERNWTEAAEQVPAAADTLGRMAAQIDRCTAIIRTSLR